MDVGLNETGPIDVLLMTRCTSFDALVMTLVGMLNESLEGGNRFESSGFFIALGPGWFVANACALFVVLAAVDVLYKLNGNDDAIGDELDEYDGINLAKLYWAAAAAAAAADDDDDDDDN